MFLGVSSCQTAKWATSWCLFPFWVSLCRGLCSRRWSVLPDGFSRYCTCLHPNQRWTVSLRLGRTLRGPRYVGHMFYKGGMTRLVPMVVGKPHLVLKPCVFGSDHVVFIGPSRDSSKPEQTQIATGRPGYAFAVLNLEPIGPVPLHSQSHLLCPSGADLDRNACMCPQLYKISRADN